MSSHDSIIHFVSNIVNLSSPDLYVLAQSVRESLFLTVKVYGDSPGRIAQFLSAILHLRPDPDIVARIRLVDESLELTLKVSGESLINLERSLRHEIVCSPTTPLTQLPSPSGTRSDSENPRTPPLTPSRSPSPPSTHPNTPNGEDCRDCDNTLASAQLRLV